MCHSPCDFLVSHKMLGQLKMFTAVWAVVVDRVVDSGEIAVQLNRMSPGFSMEAFFAVMNGLWSWSTLFGA